MAKQAVPLTDIVAEAQPDDISPNQLSVFDAPITADDIPPENPGKKKRKSQEPKELLRWTHKQIPLDDLYRLQHNPRKANEKGRKDLKKSIDKFGLAMPIVVNLDHTIIGGHQRIEELLSSGQTFADCWVCERQLSAEEVDELCIRLNKNIAGDWDGDLLAEHFSKRQLEEYGFEDKELRDLDGIDLSTRGDDDFGSIGTDQDESDDMDPRLQDLITVSQSGDLFEIRTEDGKVHRLLCGSCTDAAEVERLFAGEVADITVSDAPYGVNYTGTLTKQREGIENDAIEDYNNFFGDFLRAVPVADYNTFYLFMSDAEMHSMRQAWDEFGGSFGSYLPWLKDSFVFGRKDYSAQHELILYGWKGKHEFFGATTATTLLNYDRDLDTLTYEELQELVRGFKAQLSTAIHEKRPTKNPYHPTMKPVELIGRLLRDGSAPRARAYDGFLGSGTMLLACEKYERNCYGCEIDPFYFDVVIGRYCKWMAENGRAYELVHVQDASGQAPAEPKQPGHFLQALEDRLAPAE